MDECCGSKEIELRKLPDQQKWVIKVVLAINLFMFVIEVVYGLRARSTALLADSLDMFGDASVYTLSLYAIGRGDHWNARVSLAKGTIMALLGVGVLGQALYRFLSPDLPVAELMGWIGALALLTNSYCAVLLFRHRQDDINMRSIWLCSRNDLIANTGVLFAAAAVAFTQSKYPDLAVGLLISLLFLRSSFSVLRESVETLRDHPSKSCG